MKMLFWLCALAPLAALGSCGDEGRAQDVQVVVAVSADVSVGSRLARLDAKLFADTIGVQAQQALQFAIGASAGATAFPFSFVVRRPAGTRVRLELLGYGATNATPVIEHKVIVAFDPGVTNTVSLRLGGACLDRVCARAEETCVARSSTTEADCAPITLAGEAAAAQPTASGWDASIIGPDASPDASPSGALDAEAGVPEASHHDAGLPVASHAGAADASMVLPAPPMRACPADHACTLALYPCLASDDGAGYSCRGQYAAWPMPDSSPGAKVAPRYSLRSDGVVADEVTGLAWQRKQPSTYAGCTGSVGGMPGDTCTWAEANRYCEQLDLAGLRWRLPSKIELESLLDYTQSPLGISVMFFPGTSASAYWSITRDAVPVYADSAWTVNFSQRWSTSKHESTAAPVRCVRTQRAPNAPPASRFSRTSGVVRDAFTTLEWSDTLSPATFRNVAAAATYCAGTGERFRVPTAKELLTLTDITREVATDPEYFPQLSGQDNWLLWSRSLLSNGEPLVYSPALGMVVPLSVLTQDSTLHVRCVR